jgi:hypothetical protein
LVERQVSNAWETPTPRLGFSPVRYLGVEVDDALEIAKKIDV